MRKSHAEMPRVDREALKSRQEKSIRNPCSKRIEARREASSETHRSRDGSLDV